MKFYETQFDEYINSAREASLHPKLLSLYDSFPDKLIDLKINMCFN